MDFTLPPPDDPRRQAIRQWLVEHPASSPATLAEAGYVVPGWPPPWGLGADPEHQLIISEELDRAGIDPGGHNPIGIGWAGPTILAAGTETQKDRFLWPLLKGEERWAQLFSEPGAGSDLASLQTKAVRDGDRYLISGQKVWTTWAGEADFGILLARTDPGAPAHRGISYFLCPMRQPGIEVRPIREMTGRAHFNEVFLNEAVVPRDHLLGDENDGWRLAKLTLGNERVSLSTGGVLWGMGPTTREVLDRYRPLPPGPGRDAAARLHIQAEVMRFLGYRMLSAVLGGRAPGAEVAVRKLLADVHGQRVMNWARERQGSRGVVVSGEEGWEFLFSPALTVGGGTTQILKNIIAEQILGLPKDAPPAAS